MTPDAKRPPATTPGDADYLALTTTVVTTTTAGSHATR